MFDWRVDGRREKRAHIPIKVLSSVFRVVILGSYVNAIKPAN